MKKVLVIFLVGVLMVSNFVFAGNLDKGFNEFGYNYNARIFNGTMNQYYSARAWSTPEHEYGINLIMKWSKNFVIQGSNEGSWLTNHFTWYTNDYEDDATYYGYMDVNNGEVKYRVEEFIKMKSYIDEPDNIEELEVIWGNFIITMDHIKVYDVETGELVDEFDVMDKSHPGLGNMKF